MNVHYTRAQNIGKSGYPEPYFIKVGKSVNSSTYGENTMNTSVNRKVLALRFARTLVVTVLGLIVTWLASPAGLAVVGDAAAPVVLTLVVPSLAAVDKWLRERWKIKKEAAAAAAAAVKAEADRAAKAAKAAKKRKK